MARCTCTPEGIHGDDLRLCTRNRAATHQMMSRAFQPSLPTVRTVEGKFVRFPEGEEWHLPHGAEVHDGIIRHY